MNVFKRKGRSAAVVMLAVLVCLPAAGTDLLDVVHLAQASDPTFESARFALEGVRERVPQARAGLLPTINLTGNSGTTRADTEFTDVPAVDRHNRSWTWSLALTQPLVRIANLYAYRASERMLDQAEAQFAQAEQDLYLRSAQAYFGVILAEEAIGAADAELNALNEQLQQVRHGVEAGTHSVTDLDETKARLGLARARQVAAKNELESRVADLEKITGQPLGQMAVLSPSFSPVQPKPMDSHAWIAQARSNYPAVRAHQAAFAAAEATVKKNRADRLPTLDLVASSGRNFASDSLTTPQDYSTHASSRQLGFQLNVPLAAGGGLSARVREAVANMGRERADLEAAIRQAGTEAQQAFAGVVNGMAQIDALDAALESAESAVKGNQIGFRAGLRINLDVLNAQQELYATQRNLSKARYETLLQGLRLKAAAGVLSEHDVLAVNAMLQPKGPMQ